MATITTSGERPVDLHVADTGGEGRPIVLIHGWPLSGESFAPNIGALTAAGLRVVTYDRRGFGRSGRTEGGYEYDTLAADLAEVMDQLDLRDAVLLGFSMGGGEVARYLSAYGSERVAGAVFSGSICPALCATADNPDGAMPLDAFRDMAAACATDHEGFLDGFVTTFFSNAAGLLVGEDTRRAALDIALQSDPRAASECIMAWATDLRDDCAAIDVPVLLIHGDGDQNVPLAASSARAVEVIPDATLHVIPDGCHGLNVTHGSEWERVVIEFAHSR